MFSENSRKQSSIYRQILGRQTKHVNMCIRGPVLGRKSIDLIIRKDSSEKTGTAWRVPCFFHFLVHSLGICDAMCTEVPWSQRCGTSLNSSPACSKSCFPRHCLWYHCAPPQQPLILWHVSSMEGSSRPSWTKLRISFLKYQRPTKMPAAPLSWVSYSSGDRK